MFYAPELTANLREILLDEQETHHAGKVLRLQPGDAIAVTNGNGVMGYGHIESLGKKECRVSIDRCETREPRGYSLELAVSPLKNRSRMEWLLEKVTEAGVEHISLVNFKNTERTKVRTDRLEKLVISAMKQSNQTYKPTLTFWHRFGDYLDYAKTLDQPKFVAECETPGKPLLATQYQPGSNALLMIGPEGDLAPEEIRSVQDQHFHPVSLGDMRLRTETAALSGIIMMHTVNQMKS